jgi:hypothetical protein
LRRREVEIHHARCDAERRLGELTKHRLETLIASGRVEIVPDEHPTKPDFYHRTLARLLIDGVDVGCILMREGYARPWRGHREDWCNEDSLSAWADQPLDCGSTCRSIEERIGRVAQRNGGDREAAPGRLAISCKGPTPRSTA